jgi:outer membrane receptor protein involved in Fe transport
MKSRVLCALAVLVLLLPLAVTTVSAQQDDAKKKSAEERASSEEQQPPSDDGPTEYVEVVVPFAPRSSTIASKLALPLQLTPANVGSVPEPLMLEQDAYVLTDALRNVSSLNVQAQGGVHDFFMIRGYDSISGSLVMTDGAVEPESTWYPTYNVAGVEVLKGPSGFLYGTDGLAGTVNIVRKQPVETNFATFGLSGGSFGTYEGTLDWNRASGDGSKNFRVNGLAYGSDNWRDIGDASQYALNPSFTWKIGEASRLNVNAEYVQADFSPDSGLPLVSNEVPDVPRERSYQTPMDFSEQDIARFQADYETKVSDGLRLRNKFYYRGLDWLTSGTQFAGVFPAPPAGELFVSRLLTSLDDDQEFLGNQFEGVFRAKTGTITHDLLAGIEVKYLTDDYSIDVVPPQSPLTPAGIPAISLENPVETAQPVPGIPYLSGTSDSWVYAPYVTDQMTFSTEFQVLLGARWDVISRDDERVPGPLLFPATTENLSRDDDKVSPMVGVLWAPNPTLSFYANGSEAFAPAGVRVFGDLEPEKSTGFELGTKKKLMGNRMRATFAVYQLERENVAIPDDLGVTQQAGDQRSRGVEVELAAEPARGLHASLAYAYTDAELTHFAERVIVGFDPFGQPVYATVDRSGNDPAFVPQNLVNLWVGKTFSGGLGIGGGARFIDEQFVAEDNAAKIDSAIVIDATVFYELKSLRLSLNFKNLLDEEYEMRGFGSTSVLPAQPFAVFAGLQYRM